MLERIETKMDIFAIIVYIVSFLGSLLTIIGMVSPFGFYPNDADKAPLYFIKDVFIINDVIYTISNLINVVILFFIFLILIISILGLANSFYTIIDRRIFENMLLISFGLFIFLPMFLPMNYFPAVLVLTNQLTSFAFVIAYWALRSVSDPMRVVAVGGFYTLAIGLFLLIITFFLILSMWFWKRKGKSNVNRIERNEKRIMGQYTIKDLLSVLIGILVIISGVGIICGIALPNYSWKYRFGPPTDPFRNPSFLLPEEGVYNSSEGRFVYIPYPDFSALLYLLFSCMIVIYGILLILTSLKVLKKDASFGPLIVLVSMLLFLPIFNVHIVGTNIFYPTFIQIISYFYNDLYYESFNDAILFNENIQDYMLVITSSSKFLTISFYILLATLILAISLSIRKHSRILSIISRESEIEIPDVEEESLEQENEERNLERIPERKIIENKKEERSTEQRYYFFKSTPEEVPITKTKRKSKPKSDEESEPVEELNFDEI